MLTNEIKKTIKLSDSKERSEAFFTLYGAKSQKELLEQFENKVKALRVTPAKTGRQSAKVRKAEKSRVETETANQYPLLLELVLEYSHAIFFLYSKSQINKNIIAYQKVALTHLDESKVKKVFGFIKRLRDYKEIPETSTGEGEKEVKVIDSSCVALENINTLKTALDNNDLKVRKDQVEDKKAYMKFAIISLATGATATDITDIDYTIDTGRSIFDSAYIGQLIEEIREYQETRQKPLSERGIRNGVDKLQLALSPKLKKELDEKAKKAEKALSTHCRNFNHLVALYKECNAK